MIRFLWLCPLALSLTACAATSNQQRPKAERQFHITYEASVTDLTPGKKLQVWIPIPHDDPHQTIRNLQVTKSMEIPHEIRTERVYGNTMLYLEGETGDARQLVVRVDYDVTRESQDVELNRLVPDGPPDGGEFDIYRRPSSLCIVNDEIRSIAAKLGTGEPTVARARAFYDHVASEMEYDKSGVGWGLGSTVHACDAHTGNCTDFHSYFVSLCLASDIASRFQIGLFGNYESQPGEGYEAGGYHCWAEFRVPGKAWVPVDISEADKGNGDFFGYQTPNRVTLSTGRDIVLSPQQNGDPLNYFLDPYAELGNRPHPSVAKKTRWLDK